MKEFILYAEVREMLTRVYYIEAENREEAEEMIHDGAVDYGKEYPDESDILSIKSYEETFGEKPGTAIVLHATKKVESCQT
jgi:hypothetical protein